MISVGDRYVAFATNIVVNGEWQNVPMRTSTDLVAWRDVGDALAQLPAWAEQGATWAPTVVRTSIGYTMYFSARDRTSGRQCIGSATSASVTGPYTASQQVVVCEVALGGAIDPEVFTTAAGEHWLLWKNDGNCCGVRVSLWAQRLGPFGQLTGTATRLLSAEARWERGVIENPSIVEHDGVWVLLYSGGRWDTSGYGTGTAICFSLASPCVRQSTKAPTFAAIAGTAGNGGASVFVDAQGRTRVALHAWTSGKVGPSKGSRLLWIASLRWSGYTPTLGLDAVRGTLSDSVDLSTTTPRRTNLGRSLATRA